MALGREGGRFAGRATGPLVVLSLVNLIDQIDVSILRGVLPQLEDEFGLSDWQLGALGFAFVFINALATIPAGWAADRVSRRRLDRLDAAELERPVGARGRGADLRPAVHGARDARLRPGDRRPGVDRRCSPTTTRPKSAAGCSRSSSCRRSSAAGSGSVSAVGSARPGAGAGRSSSSARPGRSSRWSCSGCASLGAARPTGSSSRSRRSSRCASWRGRRRGASPPT